MAITKPKSLEDYINIYKDQYGSSKAQKESAIAAQTEFLKEQAKSDHKAQINNINQKYADLERALLVQKIISERKTKELNENLGLTRSGKNLSELAATQIAYQNAAAKTNVARQNALGAAELQRDKLVSDIALNEVKERAALNKEYEKLVSESAEKAYSKEVDARLKAYETELKNQDSSTTSEEYKTFHKILVSGIKSALRYGSGYLHNFLLSLNLPDDKIPLLRSALTQAGVPADFYENFLEGSYQGLNLIPLE